MKVIMNIDDIRGEVARLLISIFLAGTIFDDFRDNEVSCRNISN